MLTGVTLPLLYTFLRAKSRLFAEPVRMGTSACSVESKAEVRVDGN